MSKFTTNVSACRHCRFYQGEGRRGGQCKQLSAPVQASWVACPLAAPLFAAEWEACQGVMALGQHLLEPVLEPAYEVASVTPFENLPLADLLVLEAIPVPVEVRIA